MARINPRQKAGYTVYFGQWYGIFCTLDEAIAHCENKGWKWKLALASN